MLGSVAHVTTSFSWPTTTTCMEGMQRAFGSTVTSLAAPHSPTMKTPQSLRPHKAWYIPKTISCTSPASSLAFRTSREQQWLLEQHRAPAPDHRNERFNI